MLNQDPKNTLEHSRPSSFSSLSLLLFLSLSSFSSLSPPSHIPPLYPSSLLLLRHFGQSWKMDSVNTLHEHVFSSCKTFWVFFLHSGPNESSHSDSLADVIQCLVTEVRRRDYIEFRRGNWPVLPNIFWKDSHQEQTSSLKNFLSSVIRWWPLRLNQFSQTPVELTWWYLTARHFLFVLSKRPV